ncbi:MAG: Eco57I restriction-modification methylase domain-containing protein [Flavobacteriales bacterium]|nr:Eco57I restriction-modification methylase domain-containing protein [Flavobacteriales bacterium]MBP6696052.1 Eco57I restriction-modification methylase domain-containing protein [Flavobacteriales bacterium]
MALFQRSVLDKYLKQQDDTRIAVAYTAFRTYFHNPATQANIREAKEEQFQERFLDKLFVNVLGYTMNPDPNYNLTTELKNEVGAKKADGAILFDGKAIAVIELKGTDTTDLGTINTQAFNYKANHTHCVYVVTSNFEKLRFFIDNAVEWLEFDLFTLNTEQFQLLWLCLQRDNLLGGIPKKVKTESVQEEELVTKRLYKDYSAFKTALWQDLCANHPDQDKLHLYKKTQKLLDRFLFVLFSEGKGLLPPNSIREIADQWEKLRDMDAYVPLYARFQKYFGYLNTGHKGKLHDIFAYNGGLFKPDEVLDAVRISDEVLHPHLMRISKYDFASEVDVNILGHIFEHSLNEIEAITAQLEGRAVDSKKTKRKKDGVFYTPKYITKYIVENTVGRLCTEKKDELAIIDEDYAKGRKGRQKKTIQELDTKLEVYRDWLLSLTICDPACGSGAFLNQALDFLIAEHQYVNELESKLLGQSIVFKDIGDHILERNIYGVDINEESVEIARLSLWLRTATKGRKLNDLSGNIKCGNSLIDDPAVAGAKAFDWKKEFPAVFAKGGFDVVIGNPPYLRVQGLRESFEKETVFYENSYSSATGRFDIYVLFIEKAYGLIKASGLASMILPHKFLVGGFGDGIRSFLATNRAIKSLVHFGSEMVFDDASTYTCVLTLSKHNEAIDFVEVKPAQLLEGLTIDKVDYDNLGKAPWSLRSSTPGSVVAKLNEQRFRLKDVFSAIRTGIDSGDDDMFVLEGSIVGTRFIGRSEKLGRDVELEAAIMKPMLRGEDVKKYMPLSTSKYVIYPHHATNGKTVSYEEDELRTSFPLTYAYFLPFRDELIARKIRKKTNPKYWFSLHRSREMDIYEVPKLITPEISFGTNLTYDLKHHYHNTKCYSLVRNPSIEADDHFLLAVLNSTLLWYYLKSTGYVLRGGYFTFKTNFLEPFPIAIPPRLKQQPLAERAALQLQHVGELTSVSQQFVSFLRSKYNLPTLSRALENWPGLEFKGFLAELKKAKVQLTLAEEAEWLGYFTTEKAKAQALSAEIAKTDKEIDALVYQLYELTAEEVKVVEGR